jgi:hypothetical protein
MHENAYSSIYIFKIFSGGDTPGPPLTRGGEGTGGGEGSGAEGRGRAGERRGGEGGERGRKGEERKEGGEGRGGEEGTGRGVPILLFLQIEHWWLNALRKLLNATTTVSKTFLYSCIFSSLRRQSEHVNGFAPPPPPKSADSVDVSFKPSPKGDLFVRLSAARHKRLRYT